MTYEEFRNHCWNKWGICVGMSYITDYTGKVVDRRQSQITVKLPAVKEDGTIDLVNTTEVRFRRLRDSIEFVSKKRKLLKDYFKILEREMSKVYGNS